MIPIPGMGTPGEELEQKADPAQIEETEVDIYKEGWAAFTMYKPIEYRVFFENKGHFGNLGLRTNLIPLLEEHCGEEEKDWFIVDTIDEKADYGIQIYCEHVGWMVMVKLLDPDNIMLPKIKRIEKRIR